MSKSSPKQPSKAADSGQPASKSTSHCKPIGYRLTELIEVVEQAATKGVTGAMPKAADGSLVSDSVARTHKDGSHFKQYINLDPNLEGKAKRHAEYGREIFVRARVVQKDGAKDALSGVKVVFNLTRVDGPNRKDAGGAEPATWKDADLASADREGLGGGGAGNETTFTTNSEGWTSAVKVVLSRFAGDHFAVSAKLDPSVEGAKGSAPKKAAANYVVWRKFWYQLTQAEGLGAVPPTASHDAFAEVFAEMVHVKTKIFKKSDLPEELRDRTFMPGYMFRVGAGTDIVANVGDDSNIDEFGTNPKLNLDTDATKPVLESLIACQEQCDVKLRTPAMTRKFTGRSRTLTVPQGPAGPIISKPSIRPNSKLVAHGEWSYTRAPFSREGYIVDSHVSIESTRTSTMTVRVRLPSAAPDPTAAKPIYVRLRLRTCRGYLGWAPAQGIVAVYRPKAPKNSQGSAEDFANTAAHEFGHKFGQSPVPGTHDPLLDHPLQYIAHGGLGSHCRHGSSLPVGVAAPANWNADVTTPVPNGGDCIMFHKFSSACTGTFCVVCKPHLQLQPMRSI